MPLADELRAALTEFEQENGLPPFSERDRAWTQVWHEDTHHATAGHGNSLSAHEVRLALGGLVVGGGNLADYHQVRRYGEHARWVYNQAHRVSPAVIDVREVHRMMPVLSTELDDRLAEWSRRVCLRLGEHRPGSSTEMIASVASAHREFTEISPLCAGLGAGLVLNLLLVRVGLPPAVVHKRHSRRGSLGSRHTVEVISRGLLNSLRRFVPLS